MHREPDADRSRTGRSLSRRPGGNERMPEASGGGTRRRPGHKSFGARRLGVSPSRGREPDAPFDAVRHHDPCVAGTGSSRWRGSCLEARRVRS